MRNPLSYIKLVSSRFLNKKKFKNLFLSETPEFFKSAAELAFYGTYSKEESSMSSNIESFRKNILSYAGNEKKMSSFVSPHSGTFKINSDGHSTAGDYLENDIIAHSKTGTDRKKGILLKRIIEGTGSKRILELGTNTGFSGCYFTSSKKTELVTIEGSEQLCEIADHNLKRISKNYKILNNLFDEAIDQLIEENEKFDCVFIDGQHEKEATLHYAKRVLPLMKENSIFIFDDIYWSKDMNNAWIELINSDLFSDSIDLFSVGVCVLNQKAPKNNLSLKSVLPVPYFSRKNW